ncbi:MAG TPA: glycosyltransferase family 39 protein [Candidatus Acidoferrum sp.]|nr:glycosyltransferase family 39 protein [Candidatus Acidoferrum sp.]
MMRTRLAAIDPLWWAAGTGLLLRIAYLLWLTPAYGGGDADDYLTVARSLLDTGALPPRDIIPTLAPPLYPLAIAAAMLLGGTHHILVLQLLNLAVGTGSIVLAGRLARELLGTGTLAAWLFALHPGFILYTGHIDTEVLYQPLLLATLRYSWLTISRGDRRHAIVLGLLLGTGALLRPAGLPACALAFAVMASFGDTATLIKRVQRIALVAVIAAATIAPWSLYLTLHYHEPLLLTDAGGYDFWDGHHPDNLRSTLATTGEDRDSITDHKLAERDALLATATAQHLGHAAQSRLFAEAAWQHLGNGEPSLWSSTANNFVRLWRPWPDALAWGALPAFAAGLPMTLLVIAGLAGLLRGWRQSAYRLAADLCLWQIGLFTLVCVAFVSEMRYRIGHIDPLLGLWAGCLLKPNR